MTEARRVRTEAMHPPVGPGYQDTDGYAARLVRCPDCGQMEWWTERECSDHGNCRTTAVAWCGVCED